MKETPGTCETHTSKHTHMTQIVLHKITCTKNTNTHTTMKMETDPTPTHSTLGTTQIDKH